MDYLHEHVMPTDCNNWQNIPFHQNRINRIRDRYRYLPEHCSQTARLCHPRACLVYFQLTLDVQRQSRLHKPYNASRALSSSHRNDRLCYNLYSTQQAGFAPILPHPDEVAARQPWTDVQHASPATSECLNLVLVHGAH